MIQGKIQYLKAISRVGYDGAFLLTHTLSLSLSLSLIL